MRHKKLLLIVGLCSILPYISCAPSKSIKLHDGWWYHRSPPWNNPYDYAKYPIYLSDDKIPHDYIEEMPPDRSCWAKGAIEWTDSSEKERTTRELFKQISSSLGGDFLLVTEYKEKEVTTYHPARQYRTLISSEGGYPYGITNTYIDHGGTPSYSSTSFRWNWKVTICVDINLRAGIILDRKNLGLVKEVIPGSPADVKGIKSGTRVDQNEITGRFINTGRSEDTSTGQFKLYIPITTGEFAGQTIELALPRDFNCADGTCEEPSDPHLQFPSPFQ